MDIPKSKKGFCLKKKKSEKYRIRNVFVDYFKAKIYISNGGGFFIYYLFYFIFF